MKRHTFDTYKEYIAIHTTFTTIERHVFHFSFQCNRNSFLLSFFLFLSFFFLFLSSSFSFFPDSSFFSLKNRTTRQWWSLGSFPSWWLQSSMLSFVYIWWLIWSVYNRNCCSRNDNPFFSPFFHFLSFLSLSLLSFTFIPFFSSVSIAVSLSFHDNRNWIFWIHSSWSLTFWFVS